MSAVLGLGVAAVAGFGLIAAMAARARRRTEAAALVWVTPLAVLAAMGGLLDGWSAAAAGRVHVRSARRRGRARRVVRIDTVAQPVRVAAIGRSARREGGGPAVLVLAVDGRSLALVVATFGRIRGQSSAGELALGMMASFAFVSGASRRAPGYGMAAWLSWQASASCCRTRRSRPSDRGWGCSQDACWSRLSQWRAQRL